MATFRQFEDILAWQKARELVARIYQVSLAGDFSRDFAMRDQMRRASLSIPSNIAEGFERGGRKEFILFLGHAKGSCGELRSQLYRALDQDTSMSRLGGNSTTPASKSADCWMG